LIYGLDNAVPSHDQVTYNPPTVLVIGAEGQRPAPQVKQHCDAQNHSVIAVRWPLRRALQWRGAKQRADIQ
jgi:hypothetical protein